MADMKQSRISQIEDPNYEGLTLSTAKRIASALDIAIIFKAVSYSKFVNFLMGSTSISMRDWTNPIPAFDDDRGLRDESGDILSLRVGGGTAIERQAPLSLPEHGWTPNIVPPRPPRFSNAGSASSHNVTLRVIGA